MKTKQGYAYIENGIVVVNTERRPDIYSGVNNPRIFKKWLNSCIEVENRIVPYEYQTNIIEIGDNDIMLESISDGQPVTFTEGEKATITKID